LQVAFNFLFSNNPYQSFLESITVFSIKNEKEKNLPQFGKNHPMLLTIF